MHFFKLCYMNLQIEVVNVYLYVYRPLNCMQVQYIFLYAWNLTQYFIDACCIIVGHTDNWTNRRTDTHRESSPLACVQTHQHKYVPPTHPTTLYAKYLHLKTTINFYQLGTHNQYIHIPVIMFLVPTKDPPHLYLVPLPWWWNRATCQGHWPGAVLGPLMMSRFDLIEMPHPVIRSISVTFNKHMSLSTSEENSKIWTCKCKNLHST